MLIILNGFTSCGSSRKVIIEKQTSPTKQTKAVTSTNLPKKADKVPEKPLTNKEKIVRYIDLFAPIAQQEMKSFGIPASITIAQGILESGMGFGRLAVEGNNHFGIKCHTEWDGKRIYHDDDEKGECFRVYADPKDSFRDHSLFLRDRSRYAFLFELKIDNYKSWAKGLKKAGYATDPKYPDKLISLIERFDLTKYDLKKNELKLVINTPKVSKKTFVHKVEKGDTLYSVSKKYNVTLKQIIELNNIKDQTIFLGQSLTIPSNP
ncbi:glucosaminidase domain-containing protein [Flavobacteriaceae bacterium]|nr:glucosaminidase domain-containing protein [Flavobacteriaceae bacterium]MDA9844093.1 glucosaminidase domain-containing protein [Flavobacteriaceae bacterium]MDB2328084.1 glucosaminidase domain-containing protein [Flavobacteriaceae bacterium]